MGKKFLCYFVRINNFIFKFIRFSAGRTSILYDIRKNVFNFQLGFSLKGNGFRSKASIVNATSDETLDAEPQCAFYSYKNIF